MKGIGIDVIALDRMAETVDRSGEVFLKRVFSDDEIKEAYRSEIPTNYLASAFAGKEAVLKALVPGRDQRVDPREIEIGRGLNGEPLVRLLGEMKAFAETKGCRKVLLSISYEKDMAVAMAFADG